MRQVSVNIRIARRAQGHTQESLARALNLGLRTIQTWEAGVALPSRRNLEALASELGCKPGWFYAADDQRAAV